MVDNPFTPNFGETPVVVAGRDELLGDFDRAFTSERRRPELCSLIVGARGTGKTSLLNMIAERAEQEGWLCVRSAAVEGLLEDTLEQLRMQAAPFLPAEPGRRVQAVTLGSTFGVEFADQPGAEQGNWRTRMSRMLDALAERETGVLITIDEVRADVPDLIQLASAYQLMVREGRRVSLVMAGLPFNVDGLLQDKSVSFLRRARLVNLGRLEDADVSAAFAETFGSAGKEIEPGALSLAVREIEGFPFLMQLLGYETWEVACGVKAMQPVSQPGDAEVPSHDGEQSCAPINVADVRNGADAARIRMENQVLRSSVRDLSEGDLAFLAAMLPDEGASRICDIATRMGRSSSYVCQYRTRLISAGIIAEKRRGYVRFELPYMRDYLLENGFGEGMMWEQRRGIVRQLAEESLAVHPKRGGEDA